MDYERLNTKSDSYLQALHLLESNKLNTSDITDEKVRLWSAEDAGVLVGVIGFEQSLDIGLLRSLVVTKEYQNRGIAGHLCKIVFDYTAHRNIKHLCLLTETASNFFSHIGFVEIDRINAPEGLRKTEQFTSLCSKSAKCMLRIV